MAQEEPDPALNVPPTILGPIPIEVQEAASRPGGHVGRYLLLSPLGQGGMGSVYRAWDPSLSRVVALKRLHRELNAGLRERFLREGRATARLRHPGIVTVYDVGESDGKLYLAMELVTGKTLTSHLDRGGPEGLRERIALLRDVAEAVGFAHSQGIVHRDLKPENVLVSQDGRPIVTDFGLAKDMSGQRDGEMPTLTETGDLLGTPSYMSPEQAAGRAVLGPTADVFSLGVMLYQALAGRLPFDAQGVSEILRRVQEDDPVPPRRFHRRLPLDLESVCMRALEKDPSRRYVDGRAFAEDLSRWLAGDPVSARPVSALRRAARWGRRNRTPALATSAVLLLLAAGASLWLWRGARARTEAAAAVARAQDAVQRARDARSVGNLDLMTAAATDGEREVSRALQLDSGSAGAYLESGRLRALLGRLEEARSDLDRAVFLAPADPVARAERGRVLARLYRSGIRRAQPAAIIERMAARPNSELEKEDPVLRAERETAQTDLEAAAAGSAPGAKLDLLRAWLCHLRGEWDASIDAADRVLRAEPSEEAHLMKALSLMRRAEASQEIPYLQAMPDAIQELDEAIRISQGFGEAWLARSEANLRFREGQREAEGKDVRPDLPPAISDARQAAARGESRLEVDALIAQALWIWGELLTKESPRRPAALVEARDKYKEAIDLLESASAPYEDVTGLYLRGKLWDSYALALQRTDGDPREAGRTAVARLEELLQKRPSFVQGYIKLGHLYTDLSNFLGRYDGPWQPTLRLAIEAYSRGLALGPESERDAWGIFYRGSARYELAMDEWAHGGDPLPDLELAAPDYDAALQALPAEHSPQAAIAHLLLAMSNVASAASPAEHLARAEEYNKHVEQDEPQANYEVQFDCGSVFFLKAAVEEAGGRPCEAIYETALEHFTRQTSVVGSDMEGWLGVAAAEAALARARKSVAGPRVFDALSHSLLGPAKYFTVFNDAFVVVPLVETLLAASDAPASGLLQAARLVGVSLARPGFTRADGRLRDLAFQALDRARRAGPLDTAALRDDLLLAPLRADPRWKLVVGE